MIKRNWKLEIGNSEKNQISNFNFLHLEFFKMQSAKNGLTRTKKISENQRNLRGKFINR